MRNVKLVLFAKIIVISLMLIACSGESNPVEVNNSPELEGNTYYNPLHNFKISAPEDWSLSKDIELSGNQVLLFGEMDGSLYYLPSFNIIAQHTGSRLNMDEFIPSAKESIANMFEEVEFYSANVIDIGGLECAEMIYKMKQNGSFLMLRQLYFSGNQSIIVITFSSLDSHYVQFSDDFDSITNSLRTIR